MRNNIYLSPQYQVLETDYGIFLQKKNIYRNTKRLGSCKPLWKTVGMFKSLQEAIQAFEAL
jgi:hypothetical protein